MTGALVRAADRLEGKGDSPRSRRLRLLTEHPTTTAMASHFDYLIVVTDALVVLETALEECERGESGRLVCSMPPQEGKTTLLRWFCVRLLIKNPDLRIGYVSYAAALARASGRYVRNVFENYSLEIGLAVGHDRYDAGDWTIEGHRGGMVSVGVGGALTGRPIDFLVVDDPLSGQKDADSVKVLAAQEDWWHSTARTRLAPTASAVVTQTRWVEADLAGNRIAEGWPQVNIPAVADGETPDALNRERGRYLISTRGRTPEQWQATRKEVGERVWAALYQGRPAPLEGGIFRREWITRHRMTEVPKLRKVITVIDPADNTGKGDEAGIITGGVGHDGRFYILADDSGHMTVERWFRVAFLAGLRWGASEVCYERSLSGLARRAKDAWRNLLSDARTLYRMALPFEPQRTPELWDEVDSHGVDLIARNRILYEAAVYVSRDDADAEEIQAAKDRLDELWTLVPAVLALPETGLRVRAIRPDGDKQHRALLAQPLYETGKVSHVGTFPLLEHTLVTWQEGQDSPDRMDADVYLLLELAAHSQRARMSAASGPRIPTHPNSGMIQSRNGWRPR
jgi:hypothetical protein